MPMAQVEKERQTLTVQVEKEKQTPMAEVEKEKQTRMKKTQTRMALVEKKKQALTVQVSAGEQMFELVQLLETQALMVRAQILAWVQLAQRAQLRQEKQAAKVVVRVAVIAALHPRLVVVVAAVAPLTGRPWMQKLYAETYAASRRLLVQQVRPSWKISLCDTRAPPCRATVFHDPGTWPALCEGTPSAPSRLPRQCRSA